MLGPMLVFERRNDLDLISFMLVAEQIENGN